MNDIKKRLEALERRYHPEPMLVIVEKDGKSNIITATECIERGLGFDRVYSGGNLRDLDKLLNHMKEEAFKECKENGGI